MNAKIGGKVDGRIICVCADIYENLNEFIAVMANNIYALGGKDTIPQWKDNGPIHFERYQGK